MVAIPLFAWLPLLLLPLLGGAVRGSFFHDVEVHVQNLVALPILIAGELLVHSRPPHRCIVLSTPYRQAR